MNQIEEHDPPRTEWRLYVPMQGPVLRPMQGPVLRHPDNLHKTYPSREEALAAAQQFVGSVLIEEVTVRTTRTIAWASSL